MGPPRTWPAPSTTWTCSTRRSSRPGSGCSPAVSSRPAPHRGPGQGRSGAAHRRPVRRDEGAPRRLLDHRGRTTSDAALELGRQGHRRLPGAGRGPAVPGRAAEPERRRPCAPAEVERVFRAGVRARRRHPGPPLRRHRRSPRRRSRTRSPSRVETLAGRRRAAEPGRLDRHDGPQPGDRPAAPRVVPRRPARARPRCCTPGRCRVRAGGGRRARRPPAADLHLLPSGARRRLRRSRSRCGCRGGLQTPEIARAFLVPEPTMAQRLVRAKNKIRAAHDPVPGAPATPSCPTGCAPVLAVVYLVFNEGYTASRRRGAGPRRPVRRGDPARPAARRADARRARGARAARADAAHRVAPGRPATGAGRRARAAAPTRTARRWDAALIAEGQDARARAACAATGPARTRSRRRSTPCTATRRRAGRPTGRRSLALYDQLLVLAPTRSWRSTARSRWPRSTGPGPALDRSSTGSTSTRYHLFHAIRADLLQRLGPRGRGGGGVRPRREPHRQRGRARAAAP